MTRDLAVLEEFCGNTDPRLRGNAMSALVSMGTPASLEVFARVIESERDSEVLRRAIKSVETIDARQADLLAKSLPARLDDPNVGPTIYNLLARVRAEHPDVATTTEWPVWRRLLQASRVRELPVALAPRGFQLRSSWLAFLLAFALAMISAVILDPPPYGVDDYSQLFWLAFVSGVVAGATVLTTTRRLYGTRFHFYRVAGLALETARTVLAGIWLVAPIAFFYSLAMQGAKPWECLFWSVALSVAFLVATRLGVAIGSAQAQGGTGPSARWRRLTATICGTFLTGFVMTVVCAILVRNDYLPAAAAGLWLLFTPSALAVSWRLSAQELSWSPAERWQRLNRGLVLACLLAGVVPGLVMIGAGTEAKNRLEALNQGVRLPAESWQGSLDPAGTRLPFEVEELSQLEVRVERAPAAGTGRFSLQIKSDSGAAVLAPRPSYAYNVDQLIAKGDYELWVELPKTVDVSQQVSQGLLGAVVWRLKRLGTRTKEDEIGSITLSAVGLGAQARRLRLAVNDLEEKDTYYLSADDQSARRRRADFEVELLADMALVDFTGVPPLSTRGETSTAGETLTVWSVENREGAAARGDEQPNSRKAHRLGVAEDLDMRRILPSGEYRVELSNDDLVLRVIAIPLHPIAREPVVLKSERQRCWISDVLPASIGLELRDSMGLQLEAFDAERRDVVLSLSRSDGGLLEEEDDHADEKAAETILRGGLEPGGYSADVKLFMQPPSGRSPADLVICATAFPAVSP